MLDCWGLRTESLAGVKTGDFKNFYCGPAGLEIGAQLPETIALSILSQCHQVVEGSTEARQKMPDKQRSSS